MDNVSLSIPQYPRSFYKELNNASFLQCDFDNARKYYSKYGYDSTPIAEEFRESAKQLLSKVSQILNRLRVRFWLSSGTCLGKQYFLFPL